MTNPLSARNQTDVLRIIVASEILRNITDRDPRTLSRYLYESTF